MDRNGSEDLPDGAIPDSPIPDTAMASGWDAGEPGERLGQGDLGPDEQRLLHELERDVDQPVLDPEEAEREAEAASNDAPLPDDGGPQDDGLSPRFSNPEQA
jgi:hypothetical protein